MRLTEEQASVVAEWLSKGIGRSREYRSSPQINLTPKQIAEVTVTGLEALKGLHEKNFADAMRRGNGSDMARHLRRLQSIQDIRGDATGKINEAYQEPA